MSRKPYTKPDYEVLTAEYLEGIEPLLMSGGGSWGGGGGGGSYTPTYLNVYFLNSSEFWIVLGHGALLFESANGSCQVYSFHPLDNETTPSSGSVAKLVNSSDKMSFTSFKRSCSNGGVLIDNGYIQWKEKFSRAIKLQVPYSDALAMESRAKQLAANPPEYDIYSYNCQSFVNELLAYGGVTLFSSTDSLGNIIIPNTVYTSATRYTRGGNYQPVSIKTTDRIQLAS